MKSKNIKLSIVAILFNLVITVFVISVFADGIPPGEPLQCYSTSTKEGTLVDQEACYYGAVCVGYKQRCYLNSGGYMCDLYLACNWPCSTTYPE